MKGKVAKVTDETRTAISGKMNHEIAAMAHAEAIPADEAAAVLLERATTKAKRKGTIKEAAVAA